MLSNTEIILPSGAKLVVQPSPFAVAKALYQALLAEMKTVAIGQNLEVASMLKDAFCLGFSSPSVEAKLVACFPRVTYNGVKIDDSTFEPVERREDYMKVCVEVAKANVLPFMKSLFASFREATAMAESHRP